MLNPENMLSGVRTVVLRTSPKGSVSTTSSRSRILKVVTVCAVIVGCLGAGMIVSPARELPNHSGRMQEKGAEQFVGKWVLTVGDVYDLKDAALPAPFRDLPKGLARNLPLAEVSIMSNGGTLSGKRVLYHYAANTDSGTPAAEKAEVNLINIHAQANLL